MNREIKFRAWDKENSIWIQINKMGFWEDGALWYLEDYEKNEPPYFDDRNDWALMQYIGLKDKNGKEIYEGDVFRLEDNAIGVIKYQDGSFYLQTDNALPGGSFRAPGVYSLQLRTIKQELETVLEIIGNVYENHELLRG